MIDSFATGFVWILRLILTILGGVSAVALFAMALVVLVFLGMVVFFLVTELTARHWEKTGKQPRNKLGQFIMRRRAAREADEV